MRIVVMPAVEFLLKGLGIFSDIMQLGERISKRNAAVFLPVSQKYCGVQMIYQFIRLSEQFCI